MPAQGGSGMRHFVRVMAFVIAATGLAGCQTTTPVAIPDAPPPAPRPVPNLTQVKPKSLEPDSKSLPSIDALSVQPRPIFAEGAGLFLGLTREQCWSLAVQVAASAALLEQENTIPDCQPANRKGLDPCRESVQAFVKQVRTLAAMSDRNKAAAEALERFYQLADVEGRVEQLHLGMEVLDNYRALVKRTDPGAIPAEFRVKLDDLNTQRARSVELLFKAESGEYQLNLDLKRRLGLPGGTADRFWPSADFSIKDEPLDIEALVKVGLERHPDLQILRLAFLELSPATLPSVKEILRGAAPILAMGPIAAMVTRPHPITSAVSHWLSPPPCPDPCLVQEVAIRKQQLFDLIAAKERGTADEIRSRANTLKAQTNLVGLAHWKLDEANKKYDDWKKEKQFGQFAEYSLLLQLHVARAELIDQVMGWHAARVKLLEAQGLLGQPKE